MWKKVVPLILGLTLLNGCATVGQTTLLGVGTGAALGTGVGLAAGNNATGALIGLAVGAVVGGASFYLGAKDHEEKMNMLQLTSHGKTPQEKVPSVTAPEVRRVWVPDKIDGNRYEAGHWIFLIERGSEWTRD